MSPKEQFEYVWTTLFGSVLRVADLNACYKTATYGFLFNQRPIHYPQVGKLPPYDLALGVWLRAFVTSIKNKMGKITEPN